MPFADLSNLGGSFLIGISLIVIWEVVWKLSAMWKAAKKNSVVWFIILAVFNTLGILPILYLFVFSKIKSKRKK